MKKKYLVTIIALPILLGGCAGPRYSGEGISKDILSKKPDIVSINDSKTRDGFQTVVEDYLVNGEYKYTVQPEDSEHDHQKVTIEYVGYWGWDLALYLNRAEIEAFYQGQRVGKINFESPNSLNPNKWGSAEKRIGLMLDILFGKITAKEATNALSKSAKKVD